MSMPRITNCVSWPTCVEDPTAVSYKVERTWIIAEGSGWGPDLLRGNLSCTQCYDMPPPGFACIECGAKPPMPELPSAAQLLASDTP